MAVRVGLEVVIVPDPVIVAQAFFATAEHARHLETPLRGLVGKAAEEIAQNFAAEGRPSKWPTLADATIARRGSAHPILVESGDLEAAATSPSSWDYEGSGQVVTAALVTPDYGHFHLTGTVDMPQRDWAYLGDDFTNAADSEMADWLLAPIDAAI